MKFHPFRWGALGAGLALLAAACQLLEGGRIPMKTIMRQGFKNDDALLKRILEGNATQADKDRFVTFTESLADFTPQKGAAQSWSEKTTAILMTARNVATGDGDLAALKMATDCRACHKVHKVYPPGKDPFAPKAKAGK